MYEEEKKSIVGRLFTYLIFALGIFVISCFIFRSYRMRDIPLCDDILFNESTYEAYNSDKDNFKVYTYGLRKRFESVQANQLLQLKYMYYIPDASQMQVTVKYNTSYAPVATKEQLPLKLVLKDEKSNTYDNFFYEFGDKYGYGYIRICYENVVFTDESEYTLFVYGDIEGEEKLLGKFVMQDSHSARSEIKLDKKTAPNLFE